jgi:gas vesicle protein
MGGCFFLASPRPLLHKESSGQGEGVVNGLALLLQYSYISTLKIKTMKDQSKLIAALLVGAAAGAVLGLLFAPDKGEETRGSLAGYADDLVGNAKDRARSAADQLREYGNSAYEKAKSKFGSAADDLYNYRDGVSDEIRSNADDVADDAQDHVNKAKSKVKDVADDVNDSIENA